MAAGRNYVNGHNDPVHWSEFCEDQAAIAASEFYRNFRNYLAENPSLNARDSASSFLQRFTDCIQGDFYQCVERGQPLRGGYRAFESVESFSHQSTHSHSQDRSSPSSTSNGHSEKEHKESRAKSFLRRLSFRRRNRSQSKDNLKDDSKPAKYKANIKKEGIVHRLLDDSHTWEKCRLVLVNNSSGYLLEFYSPPKVSLFLC